MTVMDVGRAATYGAINSSPTISTLTLLSGKLESLGMHPVTLNLKDSDL